MINPVFKRQFERRCHLENMLIDYWDDIIERNTTREDTQADLKGFITKYIQSMGIDQLEDDNLYLALKEFED